MIKKTILLLFIFAYSTTLFSCDCDFYYRSYNYLKYESVFLCSIEKTLKDGTEISKYKYKIKVLELFKGKILDTLFTGAFCGLKYQEGDTIIIYANNDKNKNWTSTGNCYGNRITNRKNYNSSKEQLFYTQNQNLFDLELEILRRYKLHFKDQTISETPNLLSIANPSKKSINFNRSLHNVKSISGTLQLIHVKITIDQSGSISKIKYLNKAPRKIKKSICKYLKNSTWKRNNKANSKIKIIESFIYPIENIVFYNF